MLIAEYAADSLNAALYEIVPEIPYTDADLAYYTGGRADKEQNDDSARPAISGEVSGMREYDTIILGYPIWHGQAPRIISTFLESYDFSGKTIVPFCTSHSSGIGSSATNTDTHITMQAVGPQPIYRHFIPTVQKYRFALEIKHANLPDTICGL